MEYDPEYDLYESVRLQTDPRWGMRLSAFAEREYTGDCPGGRWLRKSGRMGQHNFLQHQTCVRLGRGLLGQKCIAKKEND